ncbi:UNVERIFIED_CONTAM: hypothetical protein GTU68_051537, partial [Idotea baltica]|nr:hypothetical protein [Idotea baltica]
LTFSLVNEVQTLSDSLDALITQLQLDQNALKDLMDTRMVLEKEIQMKKNSIFIDQSKVLPHRNRYPTTLRLQGY